MTDPGAISPTPTQLDRIATLRAQRGGAVPPEDPPPSSDPTSQMQVTAALPTARRRTRRPTRHAARRSRIIAAGLGASTMFGIVGLLALDHSLTSADGSSGVPAAAPAPPPIRVVVHRIPAPVAAGPDVAGPAGSTNSSTPFPSEPQGTSEPIVLTANPVVRNVTVAAPAPASAPVPTATTGGSR